MLRKKSHRQIAALAGGLTATIALAACGSGGGAQSEAPSSGTVGVASLPEQAAHIHGMAIDGTRTLLATHGGMWQLEGDVVSKLGTTDVDFMGFTAASSRVFYSSGHPNSATGFQQPVGLIESKDSGMTWNYLSRGGESDFHALTASSSAIYGYDGELQASSDGKTWQTRNTSVEPSALAVAPADPDTVLAATVQGLELSTNGGRNFAPVPQSPSIQLLSWTDAQTVWGIDPGGRTYVSEDAAATWTERGSVGGAPTAFIASGADQVRVATSTGVHESADGGQTFTQIANI